MSTGAELAFSCLDIHSVTYKLDDLLEVRRDLSIDVMFLIETWHDTDCVAFQCLRVDRFQVVDRPRPRKVADTLATNHGGVAAVAKPGIRLMALDLGIKPATLELLSVRVVTGSSSCAVMLVYRTGPITSAFFAEFTDVLDRVATNVNPLYIVGDLNIRLDRTDDAWSRQLSYLLASYGLACRVSAPTHDRGGLLDVVISRDDLPAPPVDIIDVGLSDHQLLR